jgi:hypothetical protein
MRLNQYRCNKCGCLQGRASEKLWLNSYCDSTGKNARLYRITITPNPAPRPKRGKKGTK